MQLGNVIVQQGPDDTSLQLHDKVVGADLDAKHQEMNRLAVLSAEARTVHGPRPDGP
jgi:hypothetical protein